MSTRERGDASSSNGTPRLRRRREKTPVINQFDLIQEQQHQDEQKSQRAMLEYLVFLLLGGGLWIFIAWRVLKWQRFPFHLYTVEVGFIFVAPIILLAIILNLTDRFSRWSS